MNSRYRVVNSLTTSALSGRKVRAIARPFGLLYFVPISLNLMFISLGTSPHSFFSHFFCLSHAQLLTWILGVASKQLRLLHGRVGDSTIVVNSLSPQMSELVEDAIAS